ncbi:MAG TPA: thiamine pyrophosphate-binding protein [Candidatus Binatia bacterium]|nr:thiamine pyrophosphate-binding protein [Candidatus Binatia bacterium]
MKNVDLIVRFLEQAGVRWVFGVPSGPVLPLIESLRQSSIEFVLTASETSAGFMASTIGYLSGVPGVCVSTVGPGATNLTTGVGSAWLDRAPVLAITCNVGSMWLERRIQMRIDHNALFKPLTKASLSLRDGRVADSLAHALALATEEPPGPVHLDLPEDVAVAHSRENSGPAPNTGKLPDPSIEIVGSISAALLAARRPLLITGVSFSRSKAPEALLKFIDKQRIPFVTTLHAKGFLPESHRLWAGVIGRARRTDVQKLLARADLIVAVGYDPIEINYEEWAGKIPLVHISTERAETGNDLNWILNEACDLDAAIASLAELQESANDWSPGELEKHRNKLNRSLRPPSSGFSPHEALDILRDRLPSDGILAYDVGAHTHQIASQWRTDRPKTMLATNGWSSMGYGMPAAFAAKLLFPERTVVCVVGDGGFQMTVGELAVARRLSLAVPTIVLNDGWLALMKVKQERKNYLLSGVRLGEPVESPPHYFGVSCRSAKTAQEFRDALEWALAQDGPSVIEAFVDVGSYSETVFD